MAMMDEREIYQICNVGDGVQYCIRAHSLILEFSGEFSLCLLQLLPGCHMFSNDISHLCLHQLQFGIYL